MPRELIERVVRQDNHKEAVLRKVYGVEITPALVAAEVERILWDQLQTPGDVSGVIAIPGGFLVFLTKEKNSETLRVASLTVPKRSYEKWLAQQP